MGGPGQFSELSGAAEVIDMAMRQQDQRHLAPLDALLLEPPQNRPRIAWLAGVDKDCALVLHDKGVGNRQPDLKNVRLHYTLKGSNTVAVEDRRSILSDGESQGWPPSRLPVHPDHG